MAGPSCCPDMQGRGNSQVRIGIIHKMESPLPVNPTAPWATAASREHPLPKHPWLLCGTLSPPTLGQLFWASKAAPLSDPISALEGFCARAVTPSIPTGHCGRQWDTFVCSAASLICLCWAILSPLALADILSQWLDQKLWHIRGFGQEEMLRQKAGHAHLELWRLPSPEEIQAKGLSAWRFRYESLHLPPGHPIVK